MKHLTKAKCPLSGTSRVVPRSLRDQRKQNTLFHLASPDLLKTTGNIWYWTLNHICEPQHSHFLKIYLYLYSTGSIWSCLLHVLNHSEVFIIYPLWMCGTSGPVLQQKQKKKSLRNIESISQYIIVSWKNLSHKQNQTQSLVAVSTMSVSLYTVYTCALQWTSEQHTRHRCTREDKPHLYHLCHFLVIGLQAPA